MHVRYCYPDSQLSAGRGAAALIPRAWVATSSPAPPHAVLAWQAIRLQCQPVAT